MFENKTIVGEDNSTMILHNGRIEDVYADKESHSFISDVSQAEEAVPLPLNAWNATALEYSRAAYVPQLVALRAVATPEAVAVVAGEQALNYRELNRRANQLAHYLQALGVGSNVLVGLCVERSLDMVIGLLGILKAGGAYVPMDPTYPAERLAFMLQDAQAPVLVTQKQLVAHLPTQAHVVCLDADAAMLAQQAQTEPVCVVTGDDLAYVIYTSGSTGRPKGVMISHESLLNLVCWHRSAFEVTASDRATQVASPAFDATGWELWPYLTAGASVYLPDEETRVSPALLRDWLIRREITISFLPTILAESIIALQWPQQISLRLLLTGADTLQHYPSATLPFALINNYGPTEATVVATSGQVFPQERPDGPPSIGRPIANTQVYMLDEQLRQVPIGRSGELYIGGFGLAKGYLNCPELTAERFIVHPFEAGKRLYRTGDLARYLPDGQIAFLGRADQQIKLRGYRIEPGEIVAVLNAHPAVQASVVVAREDVPGERHLVAYVVLAPSASLTANALRETLAQSLPDYMIPALFVQLDTLPQTHNGKVDRTVLPLPDAANMLPEEELVLPTTAVEERLAVIVATLLALPQVGIDENFFMLGGHSLLGTQLIMRVGESFGVELPLRQLFEAPTVRLLAAEIERRVVAHIAAMSDEEVRQLFV